MACWRWKAAIGVLAVAGSVLLLDPLMGQQSRQPNSSPRTTRRAQNERQATRKEQQPASRGNSAQRSRMAPRNQPVRQAQRPAQRTATPQSQNPNAAPGPVLEKADPTQRAAFLKLIGANWIWSPAYPKDEVPEGDCYFRKSFELTNPEFGQVHVACDNQYELYVNGQLVGRGADWRNMDVHEVTQLLRPGSNVVAIKATNLDAGAAGLVARVVIKEAGSTFESYSTDASWRTSVKLYGDWNQPRVRDSDWLAAKVYGPLGGVLPWGDEVVIAEEGSRFLHDPEFSIERLIMDEQAGSIIAMAFNASGDILASQEGGPLLLIQDKDRDGTFEHIAPFCDEITNVQGILPVGNRVYSVGDGPAGGALYMMVDNDGDGQSDEIRDLVRFRGAIGEHGPHTVRLGPDGYLYLLSGNFSQPEAAIDPRSVYSTVYEGDLVRPRNEDPQGHAVGVPAPGGTILRTDTSGSFVERVAGGFRNPYDFAFNGDGELFTYDADMEWDMGSPWYRPTRVAHVPLGGEFGWRSGWAKWPEYFIDSLPATLDIGPGSPTGMVFYDHTAFPARLQNTLFVGDWGTGQIHAIKLERNGASYEARLSTFIKGRPLNVTGLDVGPDGALYFSTGGRGTDGGIYRVRWMGSTPPQDINFGRGIQQALNQGQLSSDWARMRVASVKRALGDAWQRELQAILVDRAASKDDRIRAIDLMTFFGPAPEDSLLLHLARDNEPEIRVRAARLMGLAEKAEYNAPLAALLSDADAWVRRVACEAIARRGGGVPAASLVRLLGEQDRFVAFAARRALEKYPAPQWQPLVLSTVDPKIFLRGAAGLLIAHPSKTLAQEILARCEAMLAGRVQEAGQARGQMSEALRVDLLRVAQLALVRGEVDAAEAQTLAQSLLGQYPATSAPVNRELVRLLAYLQPNGTTRALAQQIESDIPEVEKLHIAAYAPRIKAGWSGADKIIMLRFYEQIRALDGGHSLSAYVENFAREYFATFTLEDRSRVIAAGESFPASTLSILAKLPERPGPDVLAAIRALDQRLEGMEGEPVARLRVGIVAVLGGSGEEASLQYLRNQYYHNPDRRAPVAMSLTQAPEGENWPILVDSLRTVEGQPARTILTALAGVNRRPDTSEPYRNAILLGLRLSDSGGELATRLLEKWVGQAPYGPNTPLADQLAAWQGWYASTFPNELPAELPTESLPNKWSYSELLSYLEGPDGKRGSPSRGAQAFETAQCSMCHRFNGRGEGIGPDLTTVAQRFQRKEILESIVYPNQVISDQYASQTVLAGGKAYTGIVARAADGSMTILQSDGQKVHVEADEIDGVEPSQASAMPEGLLNRLSLEQVADLFAFLTGAPEPAASPVRAAAR